MIQNLIFVVLETLVGFFLVVLFLLLAVILSGLYEKPRKKKDWVTEIKYIEEFVWRTSPFWIHTLPSLSFLLLSLSTLLTKWRTCWTVPTKIHIAMRGILCDIKNIRIFLPFNTSWLASRRTWYYVSFSCSGCDLTLMIKRDTFNCYSFLLKFLPKTKPYKLVSCNWQLNLLLKQQIQKKFSTFCYLCLAQQIN